MTPLLEDEKITWHSQLMNTLEKTSKSSRTTKLWVDILIKLLVLCLLLIRAKQEGDWEFHLEAVKKMIPLFFAAGHVNYPRWRLPYLRRMKAFSDNVHSHFMKVEQTIQLSATPWSGIWSDMEIEVLYNRIGKRVAGIIGQSTNMEIVKVWAYSLNAYCEVAECLDAMKDKSSADNMHKEEKKSRISHDQFDRDILGKILKVSIDIFDASQHPDVFVNVVTRKIKNYLSVNVDGSIRLGEDQMRIF